MLDFEPTTEEIMDMAYELFGEAYEMAFWLGTPKCIDMEHEAEQLCFALKKAMAEENT
jgi:hypothetical protein